MNCPECETLVTVEEDVEEGQTVECPECGTELEVVNTNPLELGMVFRADAAFAKPEIYEALEERGVKYAIRIPSNDNLERDIAELVPRPVGRPSKKPLVE